MPTVAPQPSPRPRKRVLVVDDHPLLRGGWHQLLAAEDDLEICGEAGTVPEALSAVEELRPDIVVTDITLPGRSGLDLVKELKEVHPEIPVLVVSMHDEKLYGERVLKAGGWGYIMKEAASEQLVAAIRQVLMGQHYVSQSLYDHFLGGMAGGTRTRFPLDRLTDRELEVFALIGRGKGQAQIAADLGVEPRTIEAHRTNIRKKLNFADSGELFRFAVQWFESNR